MASAVVDNLIDDLDVAIQNWDDAYVAIVDEAERFGQKPTEAKLNVATRNEMRKRGHDLPEIVRWKLRGALGGIESHE